MVAIQFAFLSALLAPLASAAIMCSSHGVKSDDKPNMCALGMVYPKGQDALAVIYDWNCAEIGRATINIGQLSVGSSSIPYGVGFSSTDLPVASNLKWFYGNQYYQASVDSGTGQITSTQGRKTVGSCADCDNQEFITLTKTAGGGNCCGFEFQCHDMTNQELSEK
ncbi:hypothetical protein B7494_g7008 [Chlorociboria aeruginascens]|nr:hypothetical protein B7494_g7008 [Chlorociboria aeruginascens]